MKEVELLQKKPSWYRRWWGIALIILVVFSASFIGLVIYQMNKIIQEKKSGSYLDEDLRYDMSLMLDELSPSWGGDDADVVIVEFGDFNCPRCLQFYPVNQRLKEKYQDKVKFYWRNYPIVKESSMNFAQAGICAERQGLFWPLHNRLFQLQGTISIGNLEEVAMEVGLDVDQFNNCLEHHLTMAQLRKDYFAAQDAEVRGTPTFIINGYKLEGALDYESMVAVIDKFLSMYESGDTN